MGRMTERDKKSDPERDRAGQSRDEDSIIPGKHGKHGGGMESEGAPQSENSDSPIAGHHRLAEDREQHDEAEKNSEANRLRR